MGRGTSGKGKKHFKGIIGGPTSTDQAGMWMSTKGREGGQAGDYKYLNQGMGMNSDRNMKEFRQGVVRSSSKTWNRKEYIQEKGRIPSWRWEGAQTWNRKEYIQEMGRIPSWRWEGSQAGMRISFLETLETEIFWKLKTMYQPKKICALTWMIWIKYIFFINNFYKLLWKKTQLFPLKRLPFNIIKIEKV